MKAHLLIVDDEEVIRELLMAHFEKHGYRVTGADSASEAIRLAHEESFNLVILDLGLSDAGGMDLLQILKASQPDLPVIVLTGARVSQQMADEARNLGAAECLSKIHPLEALLPRVERVLRFGK
jgi:DNA-binding response OmpR family regulator